MIEASFDRSSRAAAVSGVYQYDTGQRLRMRGLPSPDELLARDDLLAGSVVTMQVHFGYVGDEQTEMRLAQWRENDAVWVVDVPDEYLTRIDPVHVFVYIYYGEGDESSRAQTMYEGVFTPISRPAPNNVASDDMIERWLDLEVEVDLVLSTVNASIQNAQTYGQNASDAADAAKAAAENAQKAADEANGAADRLENIERMWHDAPIRVVDLPNGAEGYTKMEDGTLVYGIPVGIDGQKGKPGDTGPADIELSFEDGVLTITPR